MFELEILFNVHSEIIINHGNKYDEYPEHFLSVRFIKPDDCILEIRGNIVSVILHNSICMYN
jgi:hypothetical protein